MLSFRLLLRLKNKNTVLKKIKKDSTTFLHLCKLSKNFLFLCCTKKQEKMTDNFKTIKDNIIQTMNGNMHAGDVMNMIINLVIKEKSQIQTLVKALNDAFGEHKINTITVEGSNNVVIQDTKGSSINIQTFFDNLENKLLEKIMTSNFTSDLSLLKRPEKLYILLISSSASEIEQKFFEKELHKSISKDWYGETIYEWKPYTFDEKIKDLLSLYQIFSGFEICFISPEIAIKNKTAFSKIGKNVIVIADCLTIDNMQYSSLISQCNTLHTPLLTPICSKKPADVIEYMRSIRKQTLDTYHDLYENPEYLNENLMHIELELPTKQDFFRKLSNIATGIFKLDQNVHVKNTNQNKEMSKFFEKEPVL